MLSSVGLFIALVKNHSGGYDVESKLGAPFYTEAKEQQEKMKIHHQRKILLTIPSGKWQRGAGECDDTVTEPLLSLPCT